MGEGNDRLGGLLSDGQVACHPFVIGELACGNLKNRAEILLLLGRLPSATLATHDEVLALIVARRLMGRGVGWIGAHLLGAAVLQGIGLWTLDRRLKVVAGALGAQA